MKYAKIGVPPVVSFNMGLKKGGILLQLWDKYPGKLLLLILSYLPLNIIGYNQSNGLACFLLNRFLEYFRTAQGGIKCSLSHALLVAGFCLRNPVPAGKSML